ncbi:hypothetical protein BC828DRAFT_395955 [Blastocladiella britannica]|nr:hypothetical protein BC828DRAFT_395955 [Blastocladiella britannica]
MSGSPSKQSASPSRATAATATATATTAAVDPTAVAAHNEHLTMLAVLMDEANAAYAHRNFEHASMLFSQLAEALTREHGTVHPKCADVHFRYGRALLNHAIERAGVLGDAEQVRNATGKRETDLLSVVETATASALPLTAADPAHFHFGHDGPSEGEEEEDDNNVDDNADEEDDQDDDNDQNAAGEAPEEDAAAAAEDIEDDDFEIAFEVLDVARVIYEKMLSGDLPLDATDLPVATTTTTTTTTTTVMTSDKGKGRPTGNTTDPDAARTAVKRRYAEVVATLGDVSLESESFSQAVEDYQSALILQAELYLSSDRRLAETHYKLALALEYTDPPALDVALDHLLAARRVLADRKSALAAAAESGDARARAERADIDELVPELDLKVDDVKRAIHVRDHPEETPVAESASKRDAATAGPVNDLSALVKKKSSSSASSAGTAPVVVAVKEPVAAASAAVSPTKAAAPAAVPAVPASTSPSRKRKLGGVVTAEEAEDGNRSPKKARVSQA